MKPLLVSLTLCAVMLGAFSVQVEAGVWDSVGDLLTVPEALEKDLRHPGGVRKCMLSLRRNLPTLIIDTSDLTLEAARINTFLQLIIPLKKPQQGIERVIWTADTMLDMQAVLTMFHKGKLRGVRVIPIDGLALPRFYWMYAERQPKVKEALENCQMDRILELFRCRSCSIAELVGVQP